MHSDVGGGYPEGESGLAKIALEWMIKEAVAKGLLVDPTKVNLVLGRTPNSTAFTQPDANAAAHVSLKGLWWIAEIIPKRHYDWNTGKWQRRLNLGRSRTIPEGSFIHESSINGVAIGQVFPTTRLKLPDFCQAFDIVSCAFST